MSGIVKDKVFPVTLFIPDMSGYTRFVAKSRLQYTQHIIITLLREIMESNIIGLEMVEIEGDAVLFYRLGTPPSIEEIAEQAKKTFHDFEFAIKQLSEKITSETKLLSSPEDLGLKFIVHSGEGGIASIAGHTKLLGRDVIIAHLLMKNNVKISDYLLLSNDYLETQNQKTLKEHLNWANIRQGYRNYTHIGRVSYKYISLASLKAEMQRKAVV